MNSLIYLELRLLINSLRNATRSPKRLIPVLVVGLWILASLSSFWQINGSNQTRGYPAYDTLSTLPIERVEAVVFVFIASICAAIIYNAFDSGIMTFSISDIDFLFATPLPRQQVLMFRLIKDYIKYTALLMLLLVFTLPLISGAFSAMGLSLMPDSLISLSALLALIYLVTNLAHLVNIIFTFGFRRLQTAGIIVKSLIIALPAAAVAYTTVQFIKTGDIWVSLLWLVDSPIPRYFFAPASWAAKLVLAPLIGMTNQGWGELFLLWSLAGATFLMLLGRRENIYEPAIQTSMKSASRRAATLSGDQAMLSADRMRDRGVKRRGIVTMPAKAGPAEAVFWKNVLVRFRSSLMRVLFSWIFPILAVFYVSHAISSPVAQKYMPLLLPYLAFLIPITVQSDLRAELRYAGLIKSTPISAEQVVLAQVLSTMVFALPGIFGMALAFWALMPASRGDILISSFVLSVFLTFTNTCAYIIGGLLYPNNKDMAQNYLCVIVGMLLSGLVAFPTVVVGFFLNWYLDLSVYATAAGICLVNLILGAAGVVLAASLFRKYEPSGD